MISNRSISVRTQRISAAIIVALTAMEAIPLVFAIRHLDRVFGQPQSGWQMLGALVVAAAFIGHSARNPEIRRNLAHASWLKIPAILLAITAGIVEEIYFRQVLMNALQSHGVGVLLQILASGIAFGAAHAVWGAGGGWRVMRGAVVATTMLGLAVLYVLSGRAIVTCIEAHVLVDLVLEPALIIFAVESATRRRAGASPRPHVECLA